MSKGFIIREVRSSDLAEIKELHRKYYENEFDLPDFATHFLCSFVICDESSGRIISASGIRTITEVIAITDKEISSRDKLNVGMGIIQTNKYIAELHGYDNFHIFTADKIWQKILLHQKIGFERTHGNSLIYNF